MFLGAVFFYSCVHAVDAIDICNVVAMAKGVPASQQNQLPPMTASTKVFKIIDAVAIAKAIPIPQSSTVAPYPTVASSIYISTNPATLATTDQITMFNYSPNFTDATLGNVYAELYVSAENLALVKPGRAVVFAGNISINSSGGYDAVISAYYLHSQIPIFSQQYPSITIASSSGTGQPISSKATRGVTWVNSTPGINQSIGNCTAFQFNAEAGVSTLSFNTLSMVSTYQEFATLVSQATGSSLSQIIDDSNATPSGAYLELSGNGLAIGAPAWPGTPFAPFPFLSALTSGIRICLLAFDSKDNMIVDFSQFNDEITTFQLFCFDILGSFLGTSSRGVPINVPISSFAIPQQSAGLASWDSNLMTGSVLGSPGIKGEYPAVLNVNLTRQQVEASNNASTETTSTLTNLQAQPTFQSFEALITRAINKQLSNVVDNSCMKSLVPADQVPTGVYIEMAVQGATSNAITIASKNITGQNTVLLPSAVDLANQNGNQFVLIAFDKFNRMIHDMSTLSQPPSSMYVFIFDGKTGLALGNVSIPVASMTIPGKTEQAAWNSNGMTACVIGAKGLKMSYPGVLNVNTAMVIPSPSIYTPVLKAQRLSALDYSPNFQDGSYAQLVVSHNNLSLLPTDEQPVVITGNIVENTSNGFYDAVVTAYNPFSKVVYFNQWYTDIVNVNAQTGPGRKIQISDAWDNTSVVYNAQGSSVSLGSSYGVQFGALQYSALSVYMENGTTPGVYSQYDFTQSDLNAINEAIISEPGVIFSVEDIVPGAHGLWATYNIVGAVSGRNIVAQKEPLKDQHNNQISTDPKFANVVLWYQNLVGPQSWDSFSTTGTKIFLSPTEIGLPTYETIAIEMTNGQVPGSPNAYTSYSFSASDVALINAAIASGSSVELGIMLSGGEPMDDGGWGSPLPYSATYTAMELPPSETSPIASSGPIPLVDASIPNNTTALSINPGFSTMVLSYTSVGQTVPTTFSSTSGGIVLSKTGIAAS